MEEARNSSFEMRLGIMLVRMSRPTTDMITVSKARHSVRALLANVAVSSTSAADPPNASPNPAEAFIGTDSWPMVDGCVVAISSEATTPKLAHVDTCLGTGGEGGSVGQLSEGAGQLPRLTVSRSR